MTEIEKELGFEFRSPPGWARWTLSIVGIAWVLQIPGFLLGLLF